MAILKHISSKNANYGDAEKYLTFEHDEFTMKPTLDADGRLIPRVDYRISSLNCGGEDFAVACMRSNLRYGKNQKREDVKSHHYIISFDPRDGPDNGLTVDRAQYSRSVMRSRSSAPSISPDTRPLSAPTRTDTATPKISMCISSLTVCGLRRFPCCPTWTGQRTGKQAASTAVRTQL